MTLSLEMVVFALGVYLSIRMISALYGIIDLWYAIGTAYPRVAGRVLVWGAAIFAIVWVLDRPYRTALLSGLLAFLLFYLSLFPLRHLLLGAQRRGSDVR